MQEMQASTDESHRAALEALRRQTQGHRDEHGRALQELRSAHDAALIERSEEHQRYIEALYTSHSTELSEVSQVSNATHHSTNNHPAPHRPTDSPTHRFTGSVQREARAELARQELVAAHSLTRTEHKENIDTLRAAHDARIAELRASLMADNGNLLEDHREQHAFALRTQSDEHSRTLKTQVRWGFNARPSTRSQIATVPQPWP